MCPLLLPLAAELSLSGSGARVHANIAKLCDTNQLRAFCQTNFLRLFFVIVVVGN